MKYPSGIVFDLLLKITSMTVSQKTKASLTRFQKILVRVNLNLNVILSMFHRFVIFYKKFILLFPEAAIKGVLLKKPFLKTLQ